jgi:hypothetical protein
MRSAAGGADVGWSALWKRCNARLEAQRAARLREAAVIAVTERLVQDTDPVIRNVSGYGRRLKEPVTRALAYIDGLVAAVPPPVALDPDRWDQIPLARALFLGPEEMRAFLGGSVELGEFFRRRPQAAAAVAVLTATRRERVIFGTALEGEIVRRDVSQVAVEFADLQIVAPAASEAEARQELKFRTLKLFTVHALKRMLAVDALREELSEQRRILEVKLRIQQSRAEPLASAPSGGEAGPPPPDPGSRILEEIDRRLVELAPGRSNALAHLEHLAEALSRPEAVMTARAYRLSLNWMGVRQAPGGGGEGLALAEVEIQGGVKRTAVLVEVARISA